MLVSAPQLLHRYIGSPEADGCSSIKKQSCWVCAGADCDRGMDAATFCSGSMTDQNQCRDPDGAIVCEACVYVRARSSPVPGRPAGPCSKCKGVNAESCLKCEGTGRNAAGGNFRNYSHLFDEGVQEPYVNASKGEKPAILEWLRIPKRGRWFAAIADSGQKHVLPYAPMNLPGGRGRVIFDETLVMLPDAAGWRMVDDMAAVLTAGGTKEEMADGHYGAGAWMRCRSDIQAFEQRWAAQRGGSFWALALWLAQRDEAVVQARLEAEKEAKKRGSQRRGKGKAPNENGGVPAVRSRPVSIGGSEPAEALRPDPEPGAGGGAAEFDGGRVDQRGDAGASASGTEQLDLFGGARPDECGARSRRSRRR